MVTTTVGAQDPRLSGARVDVLRANGRFLDLQPGRWQPDEVRSAGLIIVVSGVLLIEHGATPRVAGEVLGPGDACTIDEPQAAGAEAALGLQVLEPARLYALREPLPRLLADWPNGGARLVDALLERHRRRSRYQAILARPKVEDRLLLVLWALAERFGSQAADGALLPLRLTHATLGCLTAARRPTVTTAMGVLQEARLVGPASDGALWISARAAELERAVRSRTLSAPSDLSGADDGIPAVRSGRQPL